MKKSAQQIGIAVFSLLALAVGIFLLIDRQGTFEKTTARIDRIEEEYDFDETKYTAYVSYTVDGKRYRDIRLDSYNGSMHEGDIIEIEYDVNDPERTRTGGSLIIAIIFICVGGAGVLYFLLKLGFTVIMSIKQRG